MTGQINLNEAVAYLRELMYMDRPELLREVPGLCEDKIKKTDLIVFAFERRFNTNARPPIRGGTGQSFNSLRFEEHALRKT